MALLPTPHYVLVLLTALVVLAVLGPPPAVLLGLQAIAAAAILVMLLRQPAPRATTLRARYTVQYPALNCPLLDDRGHRTTTEERL